MSEPFVGEDRSLARPALMAFTEIAGAWSLTQQERLAILGQPVETAFASLETGTVDDRWPETIERVGYLIGIYRLLHAIFSDRQQADGWVRRPNTGSPFKGDSALALMCSGDVADLATVREYLEANRLG
ncbi:MAG: antitoxin Xre/MbcA/ParS toxin-binding domain-containing protein [Stenotrophomonas rhizophila]|uniref:antitoxin Xre/MbcA/ParS toxin-binding domain-containing protein n=1 Tax=Stenotrophomonas rhizophila TaxID=216778 RepID=UPI003D143EC7